HRPTGPGRHARAGATASSDAPTGKAAVPSLHPAGAATSAMSSRLPATPEKTIAETWNRSSTARVVVAALTRPIPARTSTTRTPASLPTWHVRSPVAMVSVTWASARSGSSSAGNADMTVTYG